MNFNINRGLPLLCLLWCLTLIAAFVAALLRGTDATVLLPLFAVAISPAIISGVLWPFSNREWAQILVIFSWILLAVIASFAIGFGPVSILFLCALAVAVLFDREKVLEALIMAVFFAACVFYFGRFGFAPEPIASEQQANWGQLTGIMSTIAFIIGALYFVSADKNSETASQTALGHMANGKPGIVKQNEFLFAEAYPGAVVKFGAKGDLQKATSTARAMFGITDKSFDKISFASLGMSEEQENLLQASYTKLKETGEKTCVSIDFPEIFQGNTEAAREYMEITLVPQEDGSVYAYSTDCTRIGSKIQDMSAAHSSAQKISDEKTLFFAGVSHELRTPLNAIIGFSDMMRSRLFGPLPGKYAEYADMIHDSGQHMLDLVGDVLDMSKVEANKYDLAYCEFDIADVVRSSMKMVRPSADAAELTLDADIEADKDLIVEADRRAVRQILLNLLSNAIKFTPRGGRVTSSAHFNGKHIDVSVTDTGTGMTAHDIAAIGTPFSQAANASLVKQRSTGLGLSLVKNLVDLHAGEFTITSHPGVGTKVLVSLPVKNPNI